MASNIAEIEQSEVLTRAINAVTPEVLKSIIRKMCQECPSFGERLALSLVVTEDKVSRAPNDSDDESPNNGKKQPWTSKRPRPRYAFCENCEKEFDVTENTSTSCKYHPGRSILILWRLLLPVLHLFSVLISVAVVTSRCQGANLTSTDWNTPDYDFFVDHDEACHGVIDSDEMRKEYPEGFIYECCERNGEQEPCTTDWHREHEPEKKRKLC
ncbi:hypothetical protein BBP40_009402 [Aspergillus hancockii]|nr:hypothetical protein BBP40_009402 [Aspergillus hancockii]